MVSKVGGLCTGFDGLLGDEVCYRLLMLYHQALLRNRFVSASVNHLFRLGVLSHETNQQVKGLVVTATRMNLTDTNVAGHVGMLPGGRLSQLGEYCE